MSTPRKILPSIVALNQLKKRYSTLFYSPTTTALPLLEEVLQVLNNFEEITKITHIAGLQRHFCTLTALEPAVWHNYALKINLQ